MSCFSTFFLVASGLLKSGCDLDLWPRCHWLVGIPRELVVVANIEVGKYQFGVHHPSTRKEAIECDLGTDVSQL